MEIIDIRKLIKDIKKVVDNHELKTKGEYARWIWQDENNSRNLGVNEYGCADAANILYTINEFYCDEETRKARIIALQNLQNAETGMFSEPTHHTIHTTAHCTASLQLFDAKPKYPLYGLHKYFDEKELYALIDGLDWTNPWPQSHQGAGVYAALVNSGEVTEEFQNSYFKWMWENADPVTGFWKKGIADKSIYELDRRDGLVPIFHYMAGGFHYMFNHEYAKMPLRYPERIIDSCIKMYDLNCVHPAFMTKCNFIEVDWLYCINRARRQTSYRHDEVVNRIEDFAKKFLKSMCSLDPEKNDSFNDLHMLFGMTCCLAELQVALPGKIKTEKPLRLVLDRRPFI